MYNLIFLTGPEQFTRFKHLKLQEEAMKICPQSLLRSASGQQRLGDRIQCRPQLREHLKHQLTRMGVHVQVKTPH